MSLKTQQKIQQHNVYTTRPDCRFCGSLSLVKVWTFGDTPLANAYLKPHEIGRLEAYAPLDVYHCEECHLTQMRDSVDPAILFSRYLYVSSTSASFRAHFEEYAQHVIDRLNLKKDDLVVDIGSNDGILLKPFKQKGMRVLGIDPAENIATQATAEGIETLATFFNPKAADTVLDSYGQAAVITANNVFAHTDHVEPFVEAIKKVLSPRGAFIFEVQYLQDLVEKNLFDIVYHEHVCYYHVTPLVAFFAKRNMEVFDVERLPVHGGSIRVFVQHKGGPHHKTKALDDLIKAEEAYGLNKLDTYFKFAERIKQNKMILQGLLQKLKAEGKKIVGYGAPAKATTLLYAFGIDGSLLDYIVDDDKRMKQGMVMPGSHIPIKSPDVLYEDKPDYCLILAWNFAESIIKNHSAFTQQGGRFIIPVPYPNIIAS